MPSKANHRGPTYLPQPKPGLLDPLGPLAEVDFLSGFRAPREAFRAPQDEPKPGGTDRGPKTNRDPGMDHVYF